MVLILVVLFICSSKKLNHLNSVSSQCARDKSSIAQNRTTIPNFLNGKKRFKNVTLQILNFIPVSLLINISSYGVMLNFLCFFELFNAVKTDTKLTLNHMGNIFII